MKKRRSESYTPHGRPVFRPQQGIRTGNAKRGGAENRDPSNPAATGSPGTQYTFREQTC